MAYVDESTSEALEETFLCLHGQPTWSYLYRKMIPELLHYSNTSGKKTQRRVVCPDLIGFGRSDKPTDESTYTFNFHRDTLLHLISALELSSITLVVQDWGGLLGLTLPMVMPERFKRLIVMNTTLATGVTLSEGFVKWRAYSNKNPDLNIGALLKRSCPQLSSAEAAAYDAPFPDSRYKAGVRRFPNLVATSADMEGVETALRSITFFKTVDIFKQQDIFMACGQQDIVLGPPVMESLSRVWRNGCFYLKVEEGGHFVQEWGKEVAQIALNVFEGHPGARIKKIDNRQSHL